MIPEQIRISEMDDGGRLLPTDSIPILRDDGTNPRLSGAVFQSRLYRQNIVNLTGGGPNALDAIPTVGLAQGELAIVWLNNQIQFWILVPGSDAEDEAGGIIRPDDYAAITNQCVWKRAL